MQVSGKISHQYIVNKASLKTVVWIHKSPFIKFNMLAESQNLMVVCDSFQRHSLYSVIFCCNNQYVSLVSCVQLYMSKCPTNWVPYWSPFFFFFIFEKSLLCKGRLHFVKSFILQLVIALVVYLRFCSPLNRATFCLFGSSPFVRWGNAFLISSSAFFSLIGCLQLSIWHKSFLRKGKSISSQGGRYFYCIGLCKILASLLSFICLRVHFRLFGTSPSRDLQNCG